jgi:8-oxo-dGTP pyrophosphatase MutT (NUDIX family)
VLDSAHASIALGARTLLVPRMSSGDPRPRHGGLSHHTATVLELILRPVTVALPRAVAEADPGDGALRRHDVHTAEPDLDGYRAAGLSTETMGRAIADDELFFAAALAGGAVLGEVLERVWRRAVMFEHTGGEEVYAGRMFRVRVDRYRHDDGEEVTREHVVHPGAVAMVAHDGEHLYLVAQPREVVGEPAFLELPAGKLDAPGEDPLDAAKRELAEEIGKRAESWRELTSFYVSAGFTNEHIRVYLATGLSDATAEAEEEERIEVRPVPLADLDATIAACRDAKTLIGLLWFRAFVAGR